ncbi:hypothetical protein BAUCODRAFT_25581 [Baudoinia panamericana UAMH 10762]|uniref:PAC domain-containing protein n=1 Tax=Baudoinia panamericana (strain UAMH 10762) TaxID=717646 RepID=M2MS98_BAUPA|nr:uncharacterized protein BAUCODRAFT_25581 [Baudoinia panamericana UAMH 10762]EMC94378.1 hypothetical protein BAUCODRAFT_25581 [Baudoinia panamericana UAMH 10762]
MRSASGGGSRPSSVFVEHQYSPHPLILVASTSASLDSSTTSPHDSRRSSMVSSSGGDSWTTTKKKSSATKRDSGLFRRSLSLHRLSRQSGHILTTTANTASPEAIGEPREVPAPAPATAAPSMPTYRLLCDMQLIGSLRLHIAVAVANSISFYPFAVSLFSTMEAPNIPRSRSRDGKRKKRFGGSLTSIVKQYPQSANDGRRDYRMDNKHHYDRPDTAASTRTERQRHKPDSIDHVIRVGSEAHPSELEQPSGAINEPLVEDFQDRYSPRPPVYAMAGDYHAQATDSETDAAFFSQDSSDMEAHNGPRVRSRNYAARNMHIPDRTSSSMAKPQTRQPSRGPPIVRKRSLANANESTPTTPDATPGRGFGPGDRSSAESIYSQETSATSIHTLPPLQTKGPDNSDAQFLEPVIEDDPRSFDLVAPAQDVQTMGMYALERRAEQLLSAEHLQLIFADPKLLLRFTGFLNSHRPQTIPLLIYYLDALKALRAIRYANAIAEALEPIRGYPFTDHPAKPTANTILEEKAKKAFDILVRDDLPAYIAYTWIRVVSVSIQRRITGTLAPHLREASEGLAEVFCLTDPSRPDNPIVFASEEFARTTQYGMSYAIGRNCRFLQGPRTNPNSVRRLAEACVAGKELTEVFVNYRRDGSPFMNLLMIAPLMDSRGSIRYFIGAQVDVSGLLKDCSELDGLVRLVGREQEGSEEGVAGSGGGGGGGGGGEAKKDEFQELSEMFNGAELDTVRRYGGRMHKEYVDESDTESISHGRPRLLLTDPSQDALDERLRDSMASSLGASAALAGVVGGDLKARVNGKLEGVYQHYILVRPAPSLRILFTSPSLRVPGILQSPFLSRIGGSSRVRSDLAAALGEGRGVTAKIRWLTKADAEGEGEGRPRWIHCTPLLGHSGSVGVWMVVLVDEEGSKDAGAVSRGRRFRPAPPVATDIGTGGKDWDESGHGRVQGERSGERRRYDQWGMERERERAPTTTTTTTSRAQSLRSHVGVPVSGGVAGRDGAGSAIGQRADGPGVGSGVEATDFTFNIRTPDERGPRQMAY